MSLWQKILLAALVLTLVVLTIVTWGSLGSMVLVFCLLTMGAALLYQRFLTNRDAEDFQMED